MFQTFLANPPCVYGHESFEILTFTKRFLLQFSLIQAGVEDVLVLSDSDVVNIQNIGYDVAVVQSGNKNSSKWLVCHVLCGSDIFL